MVEVFSLDRRKLFEQVAEHIQKEILHGTLKPGDRLPPERDLQLKFGVGRPAIREALISLQNQGLVEIMNGAPARVAMPTAEGVLQGMFPAVIQMLSTVEGQKHFQDLRLFFEVGLARRAALTVTDHDLVKLKVALDANKAAIGNRMRFIETDVAYHFVLAETTQNPVFSALHDGMSSWLKQQRVITLDQPDQERIAFAAHQKIYKAIAARDPDAAEKAMREHLLQLQAAYWDHEKAVRDPQQKA
jgi:GntR family transcriptional regulator, sialic acid-inducible nan operon repressor